MDELYEYNGKQYTLAQLQEKYGDKANDAITKFGFKKVEQKQETQEETFTYKDKSYTRTELEQKYGDKTEDAIEKFGFESSLKKKDFSDSTSTVPKLDSEAKEENGLSGTPNVVELSPEDLGNEDKKEEPINKNLIDLYDQYKNPEPQPESIPSKIKRYVSGAWNYGVVPDRKTESLEQRRIDFLDNLDETSKNELTAFVSSNRLDLDAENVNKLAELKVINEKNKDAVSKLDVLYDEVGKTNLLEEGGVERMNELNAQKEELTNTIDETARNYNQAYKEFEDNDTDIQSYDKELELLNKNYNDWDINRIRTASGFKRMWVGIKQFDANYENFSKSAIGHDFTLEGKEENDKLAQKEWEEKTEKNKEEQIKIDKKLETLRPRIKVGDINSPLDFLKWGSQVANEQSSVVAALAVPYVGYGILYSSSAGGKELDMRIEMDGSNGKINYTEDQIFWASQGFAIAETTFEKLGTGALLKQGKRAFKALKLGKEAPGILKSIGTGTLRETPTELATSAVQTGLIDMWYLDKEVSSKELSEEFWEVVATSSFMGEATNLTPRIAGTIARKFTPSKKLSEIKQRSDKMNKMVEAVQDGKTTPDMEQTIKKVVLDGLKANEEDFIESAKTIDKLTPKEKKNVLNQNVIIEETTAELKQLEESDLDDDTKNILKEVTGEKLKEAINQRDNILNAKSEEATQEETKSEVETETPSTEVKQESVEPAETELNPENTKQINIKPIKVYHGGSVKTTKDLWNNNPLFVSEDKNQAKEYTKENEGSVQEFTLDNNKVADEDIAREVIKELGLKPKDENWVSDELNLFELIDPVFDTSLTVKDINKLFKALESKGYEGVSFMDTNLKSLKQDIKNIAIFNPQKTLNSSNETTPSENIEADGSIQPRVEPNIQQGKSDNVQPSPNVGEVKNEVEVKPTVKKVKSGSGNYDVTLDEKGNVSKIHSEKDGREIKKFVEVKYKASKKNKQPYTKIEINRNWAKIESDAKGVQSKHQIEQQAKKERSDKLNNALDRHTPDDAYSHALDFFARGGKVTPKSANNETGLSNKETRWATKFGKDGDTKTIEEVAEQIVESSEQPLDEQDVRNALTNIIKDNSSTLDTQDAIIDKVDQIEGEQKEQEARVVLGGLSESDLAIYEANKAEDDYISELSDAEVKEYYNQKLDEYEQGKQNNEASNERGETVTTSNAGKKSEEKAKPKTKVERIKVANAKIDDIANAIKGIDEIFGIKLKVDDVDGLSKNGVDMIDVVASIAKKAVAAGIEIDVAIQKTIEHLKKTLDFDVDINDVKAKMSEKPTQTPKKKKGNTKKRAKISERFLKGDNKKLVDALVESLELNNTDPLRKREKAAKALGSVEYEVRRQETVYNNAKKFIDKVGVFAAYDAIKNGKIKKDDTKNAVYAIILEKQAEEIINISETIKNESNKEESLNELFDFFQEVFEEYTLATVNAGQGISMINYLHKRGHFVKYDLTNQIALEEQRTGEDISTERLKELRERDAKIKEQDARIKELEAEQEKLQAQQDFDNAIAFEDLDKKNEKKAPRKRRKLSKKKQTEKEELTKYFKSKYLNVFNDATRVAAALLDPKVLKLLAIKLEEAGGNFLNFSEDVIETFGKGVKKHIPEMYKKAGGKEDTSLHDDTPSEIKVEDGKIIISRKVLRELVEEGVTDIDVAAKTIRERNIELLEDFTIREVRDALTNYGKTRELDKGDIATMVRKLKRLGILLSKKDDAENGVRPSRTGAQRDKTTPEERELNKLLNDLLDKLPVDKVDLDKKIKTALDKRETTLKNAIEELQLQIDNKKRNERTVKSKKTNPEIQKLEAKKKAKEEELNATVGVPVKTLEQKLQTRKNQLDTQIKTLKDDLSNNNVEFNKKSEPVTDSEIEQKEKERDELIAQRDELRETLGIFEKQRLEARKSAVKRAIENRKARLRDGNFVARKPKPLKEDAELKKLRRENLRLKEKYDVEAEKHRIQNREFNEVFIDAVKGALNAFRALKLTAEMSFIGIQGFVLMTDKTLTRRNINNLKQKRKELSKADFKTLKSTASASVDILKSIEAYKTLHETISSTVNAKEHKNSELDLKNHPYYEMAKKYIQLVELDTGLQDEHFVGMDFINDLAHLAVTRPAKYVEKQIRKQINKVKPELSVEEQNTVIADILVKWNPLNALERGNSRFLNDIRLQEFMLGVEALELSGKTEETHPKDYKALGMMVNTVSGTATLGPILKQSTPLLNMVFLAFRFSTSMANQSILAPIYLARIRGENWRDDLKSGKISYAQKRYLKLMLKSYTVIGASIYGLYTAAMLAWLDDDDREEKNKPRIEFDPRSSDFLGVIEGNVSTNILGSRKKYFVLAAKLASGQTKRGNGEIVENGVGYNTPTDLDVVLRFGINHLNVIPGYGARYLAGHDEVIDGEEKRIQKWGDEIEDVGIKSQVLSTYPLIIDTYKELLEEDPYMLKPLMIASFFGQQISIYDRDYKSSSKSKKLKRPKAQPKSKKPSKP